MLDGRHMGRRPFRATKGVQFNARKLRQRQTAAEAIIWEALRNRQLGGLKFRRQHPIDGCVVDFYCAQARLVVEIDGPIHKFQKEEDDRRQAWLEGRGCRVIRFLNDQVQTDLAAALARIAASIRPAE
jgi:very-short-patch-repair endonuclease